MSEQEPLSIEIPPVYINSSQQPASSSTEISTAGIIDEIPLPPQGPYKPTNQQIQTALKNAGYYTAEIDGKIGPLTKKAIKNFQAANNLEVDGKVGPKTWVVLSKYLSPKPGKTTPKR